MADFYYGSLEGGYGGRGGRGGKKSGTVGASKAKSGTAAKAASRPAAAPARVVSPTRKAIADKVEGAGKIAAAVGRAIPMVSTVAKAGSDIINVVRPNRSAGQMVMAPDGQMFMRRRKKRSKGLSGSDLKGYMRTVKLAKMLVHTPRYMKKSVGKARRRSSLSFR